MSWAHYILQVNIYLVIFYGFYKLLLDKETYFTYNRIYLVSAGLLSMFIPYLRFEWFTKQPAMEPVYTGVVQINQFVERTVVDESTSSGLGNFIVIVYAGGVLFFIMKLVYQLLSVRILLKKNSNGMAFSFFSRKVVDQQLPAAQTINNHEEVHIRQFHTADVIFFELLGILAWFNPIIYLYKHTIKSIHEYLADEAAAKFQGDKEAYALLLLSRAFGVVPGTLTNRFFNKSLIKKRIFMLHKQRSRKAAILKYGMALPLFAIMLVMSSATIRDNEKIQDIANKIPLEQPLDAIDKAIHGSIQETNTEIRSHGTTITKADPEWENFYKFIRWNIRYPQDALQAGLQGNSQVKFTVTAGEVTDVSVVSKTLGYGCDAEVMKNILAYPDFKKIPNGKYIFNTEFRIEGVKSTVQNPNLITLKDYTTLNVVNITSYAKSADGENLVYDFVSIEQQPSFPGGMEKFYKYLQKTVRYPKEAQENNIQGKVYLSFTVEKDGSLTDIKVDRGLGYGTDEESLRVIKASPKWLPGVQKGKLVRVRYNLPISFTLVTTTGAENQPVYIIDGVKTDKARATTLTPAQIESINILKAEAATKIYGDEGKNGAIVITTKKEKQ